MVVLERGFSRTVTLRGRHRAQFSPGLLSCRSDAKQPVHHRSVEDRGIKTGSDTDPVLARVSCRCFAAEKEQNEKAHQNCQTGVDRAAHGFEQRIVNDLTGSRMRRFSSQTVEDELTESLME